MYCRFSGKISHVGNLGHKLNKFFSHRHASIYTGGATFLFILVSTLIIYAPDGGLVNGKLVFGVLLAIALGVLAYAGVGNYQRKNTELEKLRFQLEKTRNQLEESIYRQKTTLQISQQFAEAQDEGKVIELILGLSIELLQAEAASFVPLDEHTQPLASTSVGKMPFPAPEAWIEYLASPAVRQKCGSCQNQEELTLVCPLLKGSFFDAMGIYCLPIRRAEEEYGILNLYLPRSEHLEPDRQALLRVLVDETTVALEGIRLRKRALSTIRQIQAVRAKTDPNEMLEVLLANLHETLDADFALISHWYSGEEQASKALTWGKMPDSARTLLEGIVHSVAAGKEPVMLGNVSSDTGSLPGVRAVMAVPLLNHDQGVFGVLLVANQRAKTFNQRQLLILQTIAGQTALVLQNANLVAQIEYKATVQERTRLAREIHDGLAQTLGFLKLKIAQMRGYLERAETEMARETIENIYQVLDETYQDARQSIDGLRIASANESLVELLQQTVAAFEELGSVNATLCNPALEIELPPEVNTQLIRIVQEALSNVRKHANARQVEISCHETADYLVLEITDDGDGFMAEDVPSPNRHGLRGMQERAELIGADYQIISKPQMGTTVSVRIPLNKKETNYETDPPGRGG